MYTTRDVRNNYKLGNSYRHGTVHMRTRKCSVLTLERCWPFDFIASTFTLLHSSYRNTICPSCVYSGGTFIASSSVKRVGEREYSIIVRGYQIDTDTQEIITNSLESLSYVQGDMQFESENHDYTLYIGRDKDSSSSQHPHKTV